MALTQVVRKSGGMASRGEIVTYTGTDRAVNTEWTETVPSGKVWRLIAIRATLVTDGNAADRRVAVTITDGTNIVFKSTDESEQTASLTHAYNITKQTGHAVASLDHYLPLPVADAFLLPAGFVIASVTTNIQAGDNWSAPVFMVEEFSHP